MVDFKLITFGDFPTWKVLQCFFFFAGVYLLGTIETNNVYHSRIPNLYFQRNIGYMRAQFGTKTGRNIPTDYDN